MKKKYALAGASTRGLFMFAMPLYEHYGHTAEIVGIYDVNKGRSQYTASQCGNPKVYDDFDGMLQKAKPDIVIVTTVDAYHDEYIIRSLKAGCNVITEKPMTTDAVKCRAILKAEKESGKKVTVTFNYRYVPLVTKIKQLIQAGEIGDVYSIHFEWLLDNVMKLSGHGASYFRRWNSRMQKSGGLLVHKSTHHFDMINWWIDAAPEKISAFGKLRHYGSKNSPFKGKNCRVCEHTKECPYYYRLSDFEKAFYSDNEHIDEYYKDGCVFSDEIDIYDTMSVCVQYKEGPLMTYSLNATTPYEGWRASINGSKGRIEVFLPETGFQAGRSDGYTISVFDGNNNKTDYFVSKAAGGHGGGDERLLNMLFEENIPDPLNHMAGSLSGAHSILIGAAANVSIKESRVVSIDELLGN